MRLRKTSPCQRLHSTAKINMPLCRPFERSNTERKITAVPNGKRGAELTTSVEIIVAETYVRVNGLYRKSVRVAGNFFQKPIVSHSVNL